MKVAILCEYPINEKGDGAFMHIDRLTRHLSHVDGIEAHVITFGDESKSFKKGNLNVHVLRKVKPFTLWSFFLVWRLIRKAREIDPDVVHGVVTTIPYSTAVAFIRNKPTVLSVLGVVAEEVKYAKGISFIVKLVNKLNEKYVVSKIPNIIVQANHIKDLVSKMTGSKIYVVPEGIEFSKTQDVHPHDLNKKVDIFLPVALVKLKGVDLLIRAIPRVIRTVPDLKVHIAGSGEEEARLKSLVKELNLESHVTFLGYISDEEEIIRCYEACKIVVVPSRWDVEPFAPLNAAASGKPPIVSDMCNSSVVDDGRTGFTFKSEDIGDLTNKIVKLLTNDKMREEMGRAAMEKAKEYDWERIAERIVEVYKGAIANFRG
jgi:glycosyltransferase involved in cell wall biosynthesis